jgi:hypothetical protein
MDKKAITKAVLKELQSKISVEDALKIWWYPDYGNKPNARLTKPGLAAISQVMQPFKYKFEYFHTGNEIKQLAKMNTPYYISRHGKDSSITIFSKQLATMANMYPNFKRYIELL